MTGDLTTDPTRIPVAGTQPYDVVVGRSLDDEALLSLLPGVARCAVVVSDSLQSLAKPVVQTLASGGIEPVFLPVPAGESAKDTAVIERLWRDLGAANLGRADAIVAVGGGATTDVAGFAAATWLRGIRWVALPTTLLGAVDAAVGGKTGINTETGKNLVGAFHSPVGVLVDLDRLQGLPTAEWVNGLAEIVKAGFIADPEILTLIEEDPVDASSPTARHAEELIRRSIKVKADVVGRDPREAGLREVLNYGHTLGHAIERRERYTMPHGHAVSIGLVYAAELARRDGRLDAPTADRHRSLLSALGLPSGYPREAWPELREAIGYDKKSRGATLRFVVLEALARPAILAGPSEQLLEAAYQAVAAEGAAASIGGSN